MKLRALLPLLAFIALVILLAGVFNQVILNRAIRFAVPLGL